MPPQVNDVVTFQGLLGRVCQDVGMGFWCVRFTMTCLRVHESHLVPATGSPPPCTDCHNC